MPGRRQREVDEPAAVLRVPRAGDQADAGRRDGARMGIGKVDRVPGVHPRQRQEIDHQSDSEAAAGDAVGDIETAVGDGAAIAGDLQQQ